MLRTERLTDRELEILRLVSEGFTGPEIADMIGLSVSTVQVHKLHIFQKLDVHTAAEAVAVAIRAGVV